VISVAVRRTAMWSATGLVAGLAAAVAVSRMLAHALDFIEGIDAMMLSGTLVVLMLVTVLASYLPLRQAVRVDPITALRAE
jgi:ABC-type lipoprotein release transport system permease subunit